MSQVRAWRERLPGTAGDVAPAVALAGLWQLELWAPEAMPAVAPVSQHRVALTVAGLVMLLPLAARRTAPLAACAAVMAGAVLAEVAGPSPEGLSQVAGLLLAAFSVALYADARRAWAGLGIIALSVGAFAADDVAFALLLFGAAWTLGRIVRAARRRTRELVELTRELELEREENARLAVAVERSRIARELHDVVAHTVSVMVVQAGGVRGLLDPAQREEREALAVVEAAGRQAMTELRRLVGMLREPVEDEQLRPPPALAQVEALVDHVRRAGLPVELTVSGARRELEPGLELSAYRIVQEALTNSLRHAGPARAEVVVRYGERVLELDVRDDGTGPRNGHHGGYGLIGMRERVDLFGGELEAGPIPSGGFRVHARLPVREGR